MLLANLGDSKALLYRDRGDGSGGVEGYWLYWLYKLYIYTYIPKYIYIYIERERETERQRETERDRERQRETERDRERERETEGVLFWILMGCSLGFRRGLHFMEVSVRYRCSVRFWGVAGF